MQRRIKGRFEIVPNSSLILYLNAKSQVQNNTCVITDVLSIIKKKKKKESKIILESDLMHSIALPINEIKLKITLSYGAYKNVTFFTLNTISKTCLSHFYAFLKFGCYTHLFKSEGCIRILLHPHIT